MRIFCENIQLPCLMYADGLITSFIINSLMVNNSHSFMCLIFWRRQLLGNIKEIERFEGPLWLGKQILDSMRGWLEKK